MQFSSVQGAWRKTPHWHVQGCVGKTIYLSIYSSLSVSLPLSLYLSLSLSISIYIYIYIYIHIYIYIYIHLSLSLTVSHRRRVVTQNS